MSVNKKVNISEDEWARGAVGGSSTSEDGHICHRASKSRRLLVTTNPITGERFEVLRCTKCGLSRTEPQLSQQELDRYYPSSYYGVAERYRLDLDRSMSLVTRSRIRRIESMIGGPGRVLDVGCGPGWLLNEMRRRGMGGTGDRAVNQPRFTTPARF